MKNDYIPHFNALSSLESDDKRDFLLFLHKFMQTTTELCFARKGQTKL